MPAEVERWFEQLPAEWQVRALRIRELILEAAPGMEEKWMFKSAPFYLHAGWLIYLSFKKGQLIVGFCQGVLMQDPERLFARTDHTQIRHYLPPRPPARMNEGALRRLIDEAVKVNEAVAEEREHKRLAKRRRR